MILNIYYDLMLLFSDVVVLLTTFIAIVMIFMIDTTLFVSSSVSVHTKPYAVIVKETHYTYQHRYCKLNKHSTQQQAIPRNLVFV